MVAVIGDDRDRLPVVARQHAFDGAVSVRLEGNSISNLEFKHLLVGMHLPEKTKPLDNPVIEVDELRFGQLVNVDRPLLLPSSLGQAAIL